MPTREEFETAASMLSSAAQQVGALTASAEGVGASDILSGGSLGAQVPARITSATASVSSAAASISAVAQDCVQRVAIIAAYERELEIYDARYQVYEQQLASWNAQYIAWASDPTGMSWHPGDQPTPPPKPVPPPSWADVRRV